MGHSAGFHNGLDIRKVEVDHRRHRDQVADALDALPQHVIRNAERLDHAGLFAHHLQQAVIRNHHQGVHILLQFFNPGFSVLHPLLAFKIEGLGHYGNRQHAQIPGHFCHNGSRAGSGAAAHTGSNKHKVSALQCGGNLLAAFFRRAAAHIRMRACAKAFCQLFADLDFHLGVGLAQCLPVGIYRDKFNAAQPGIHHPVYSVVSAAAASDDFDGSKVALLFVLEFNHVLNLPTDSGRSP